ALLDPDLPVDLAFAEGVVVGRDALDGGGPDPVARSEALGALGVGSAPAEQVVERQRDAEPLANLVDGFADGRRRRRLGEVAQFGRIEGELAPVIDVLAVPGVA